MKIKIKKEIEISLPFYCKSGSAHFYKVYSEKKCLQIFYADYIDLETAIGIHHAGLAFDDGYEEITAAEFNEVFVKAYKLLSEM